MNSAKFKSFQHKIPERRNVVVNWRHKREESISYVSEKIE